MARTKGDGPEKRRSINNGLGRRWPPVPRPGLRVAGKPDVSVSAVGSEPAFRAT